jgi:hypothetical protein
VKNRISFSTAFVTASFAVLAAGAIMAGACVPAAAEDDQAVVEACVKALAAGLPPLKDERSERFQGKVDAARARCRGGESALRWMENPWVDWANYWAAGNAKSKSNQRDSGSHILDRDQRGIDGALFDLEYQRMELIKFNLFDNNTFEQYLTGITSGVTVDGSTLKVWKEMRLPPEHPQFRELKIAPDGAQLCQGQSIRFRTLTGICNDIRNPAMGSTGQLFARNVAFETTFPDLERDSLAKNRHGGRISLLAPDPQVISRKLFTRDQSKAPNCNAGHGNPAAADSDCAYRKAPFFNVLAAYWIQFMTHDWFAHLEEARNDTSRVMENLGCTSERVDGVEQPISTERAGQLGCRKEDKIDASLVAEDGAPRVFRHDGVERLSRSHKTSQNRTTAWWDASQIYGFNERSRQRVKRDPSDAAKLAMEKPASAGQAGDRHGYLPLFRRPCPAGSQAADCDPIQPEWAGQEAAAVADNWSIGLSFLHNLFVREHNIIVDAFRDQARRRPNEDSGLRNPDRPTQAITYSQISNDELFEIARLIVAAQIAKIHTIEWTTQLLYNEPLHIGMNSNWSGLLTDKPILSSVTNSLVEVLSKSPRGKEANQLYSAFAAGGGIVGRGNSRRSPWLPDWLSLDRWDLQNPDDVNGGINHFGSPFNFPEEFVSVYRLHPLLPDMIEFRDVREPNAIRKRVPVIDSFRSKSTGLMREGGLSNWALSMGRQRLGLLLLQNHPQFLQNLDLRPRIDSKIDLPALDIIRDREHGIPRFNEFRRQIGLRQLRSFDDFIDRRLPEDSSERAAQRELVKLIREVYGQHRCDASKQITSAQRDANGGPINDCLGFPDGSIVDNIEDVDVVVGMLAETTRPHGFAISETQFQIFIINASRRLFSDRFLTSSFRPEFYTRLGIDWVVNNGPTGKQMEKGKPNGHEQEVLPFKRVLLRAMPELEPELAHVVNAFDPWARDRGEYYSLDWRPRPDAQADPSFKE